MLDPRQLLLAQISAVIGTLRDRREADIAIVVRERRLLVSIELAEDLIRHHRIGDSIDKKFSWIVTFRHWHAQIAEQVFRLLDRSMENDPSRIHQNDVGEEMKDV